jgi:cytochrome b
MNHSSKTVRAWDLPTRIFHWLLVTLIVCAPVSANSGDPLLVWHKYNGYAILTVLIWRLIWGFAGGSTSRLSAFFPWPWSVFRHVGQMLKGVAPQYLGHNPLGSVMIVLLFLATFAQVSTGLFTSDDIAVEGPLHALGSSAWNSLAAVYHSTGFLVIIGLAAIHIVANFAYTFIKKDNVIGAMVTGKKKNAAFVDQSEATGGSIGLALLVLLIAAAIVFGGIALAGGRF